MNNGTSPYLALLAVCVGVFIAADDQTVVVTVLPKMMLEMKIQVNDFHRASWTITGYLLGYVVAMPLIARMSDVWGRSRLYTVSMGMFMLGSVLAAISPSIEWLVVARVFQAVGAGSLVPISIAMVSDLFSPQARGLPLGLLGAAAEAGGTIGPLWGGIIVRYLTWPWVFWINLPLGAAVLVAIRFLVRPTYQQFGRVDYIGGLLVGVTLTTLTLGLARIDSPDFLMTMCLVAAVTALFLFLLRQRAITNPLFPSGIFSTPAFIGSCLVHFLVGGALIIGMVTVPLMANTVLQLSPLAGGLMLMRLTFGIPVGAILGGVACQRLGYRISTGAGLAITAAGFFFMSQWQLDVGNFAASTHLFTTGLGFGIVIAPIGLAALNSVSIGLRGAGAGILTASRILGMTFGLATLAAWGTGRFSDLLSGVSLPLPALGETIEQSQQRLAAFENSLIAAGLNLFGDFFLVAMVVSLIALIPSILMVRKPCGGL